MASKRGETDLTGLWEDALELYRQETKTDLLGCDFADDILDCTTVEDVLGVIHGEMNNFKAFRGEDTQWGKVRAVLKRVVDVVLLFNDAVAETAVSKGVPGGKAILVGFGVLLTATKGVSERYNALEELFSQILGYLDRLLVRLEARAELRPGARANALKILFHILRILALATKLLKKNRFVHWFEIVSGSRDMKDALEELNKLTTLDTRMTIIENYATSQQILLEVQGLRIGGEGQSETLQRLETHVALIVDIHIREWLAVPDSSKNHHRAIGLRHAGTCAWLLNSHAFRTWKSAESSLLWIHGKPGSGKTVLCAAVIDALKADPATVVAFYYFDFRDAAKQGTYGLLCSLVLHLGYASHDCAVLLRGFHARNVKEQPNISQLITLLKDLVSTVARPIYWVLDAIDECPVESRRSELLPCLEKLACLDLVHILLTSRPEVDIRESFTRRLTGRHTQEMDIHTVGSHSQDMESYIMHVLGVDAAFRNWPERLVELARTSLLEKANGMFRWVSLQLDNLRNCLPKHVESTLSRLPETLGETYLRILDAIDKTWIHDALRILQCIAFSTSPLTADALAEIFAIEFDEHTGFAVLRNEYRVLDPLHEVLKLCSGLVTISSVTSGDRQQSEIILAHFSVQEYLISSDAPPKYHLDALEAHVTLSQACIASLHSPEEYAPLSQHAAWNWMIYATYNGVPARLELLLNILLLPVVENVDTSAGSQAQETTSRAFRKWSDLIGDGYWTDVPAGAERKDVLKLEVSCHPLVCAAFFGLDIQIKSLLASIGFCKGFELSALHAAVITGNIDIIEQLLTSGIVDDVNELVSYVNNYPRLNPQRTDPFNSERRLTLLHVACDARKFCQLDFKPISQVAILRVLLDHGAEVNSRAGDRPPLHDLILSWSYSLCPGRFDPPPRVGLLKESTVLPVLECLLECGADVNAVDSNRKSALHWAVADHKSSQMYNNPPRGLHDGPTGQVLELALDHEADIGLQDLDGRTALHYAAEHCSGFVLLALLEHGGGAHVDVLDIRHETALHRAMRDTHLDPETKLCVLAAYGADIHARNVDGQTPLLLASCIRRSAVRTLLECGADVNARDASGRSALHISMLSPAAIADIDREVVQADLTDMYWNCTSSEFAAQLVKAGADVNARDVTGRTALHYACGDIGLQTSSLVQALLSLTCCRDVVNAQDENGQTALHYACRDVGVYTQDVVQLLIDRGADPNIADDRGRTALFLAATSRKCIITVLYALLRANADPYEALEGVVRTESSATNSLETHLSSYNSGSIGGDARIDCNEELQEILSNAQISFVLLDESSDPARPWMETLRYVLNVYALVGQKQLVDERLDLGSPFAIQLKTKALVHARLMMVVKEYGDQNRH